MRSRIFRALYRLSDRALGALKQSLLLQSVCAVYPKWESDFGNGCFRVIADEERSRNDWQFRLRERLRPIFENSLIRRCFEAILKALLRTPLCLYALFIGGFAVLSPTLQWLLLAKEPRMEELLLSLLAVILLLPARQMRQTLGRASEESLVFGEVRRELSCLPLKRSGRRDATFALRAVRALLAALFFALLSVLWSAQGVLLMGFATVFLLFVWQAPELGVLAVLTVLPFVQFFSHPTVLLLGLTLVVELAYFAKAAVGRRVLSFGVADLLILLFAACYFCAATVGEGGRSGLFAGLGRLIAVLFWFPVRNLLGEKRWRWRAFSLLSLSATLCAAVGICQYFFGTAELKWVDALRFSDIGGRVTSTFSNPNILAVYLLSVLPVCLAVLLLRGGGKRLRALGVLSLCAVLLCIVLTWTRGAWLAAPVAMLLFLLSYSRRSAASTALFSVPMLALLPWLPKSIVNRFASIGRLSDSSVSYRLYTWRGSLRLIGDLPWGIGTGESAFFAVYPDYAVSGTESVPHTHHLLLQVSAELGIAGGLVLCALLLVLTLATCYGLCRTRAEARLSLLAGACGVVGCLVLGLFDYIWYHPAMMLLFFFSAGVTLAVTEQCLAEEQRL